MRKIILCEGKTDSILLGHYLMKTNGWSVIKRDGPKKLTNSNPSQFFSWYKKNDDFLAIWGVGGNSMFESSIKKINEINHNAVSEIERYSEIIILMDKDREEVNNLLEIHSRYFEGRFDTRPENNNWSIISSENSFGIAVNFKIGFIVIPFDQDGALETFLLQAMREETSKQIVIDQCETFIDGLDSEIFLRTERLKLKAKFSVTLAVFSPEKVFDFIETLLLAIPWENYKTIQTGFNLLDDL